MSTAIAYSFMTMDNNQGRDNNPDPRTPRRSSNDRNRNHFSFDTVSEGGKSGSAKRRPRKRSTSGSRSQKPPKVSWYTYYLLIKWSKEVNNSNP